MLTYRPSNERETALARLSQQLLSRYARDNQSLTVHVAGVESIELPAGACRAAYGHP